MVNERKIRIVRRKDPRTALTEQQLQEAHEVGKAQGYAEGHAKGKVEGAEKVHRDLYATIHEEVAISHGREVQNARREGYEQGHGVGLSTGRQAGYAGGYKDGHTEGAGLLKAAKIRALRKGIREGYLQCRGSLENIDLFSPDAQKEFLTGWYAALKLAHEHELLSEVFIDVIAPGALSTQTRKVRSKK